MARLACHTIRQSSLCDVLLSVSNRALRNRSTLYQQRHLGQGVRSRDRDHSLVDLNIPFAEHAALVRGRLAGSDRLKFEYNPVVGIGVADLTANLLRPHFDPAQADPQHADRPDAFFHLADEPWTDAEYCVLAAVRSEAGMRLTIRDRVRVGPDGRLTTGWSSAEEVQFWAACPPLVLGGERQRERFAVLDYDARQVFGERDTGRLQRLWQAFGRSWGDWSEAVARELSTGGDQPGQPWYHSVLGIRAAPHDDVVLVHSYGTIPEVQADLLALDVRDAVLLDSGGSCALWARWLNGNQGGFLCNSWYYRPKRGAVLFAVLDADRFGYDAPLAAPVRLA